MRRHMVMDLDPGGPKTQDKRKGISLLDQTVNKNNPNTGQTENTHIPYREQNLSRFITSLPGPLLFPAHRLKA
jgi:hypothetical protein